MPGCAIGQGRKRQRFAALCGEQCARQGQQLFAEAVGQQAVAADAHEAFWQHVQEEAAEEVHGVEGHDALLAAVGIIAPAEADALAVEGGDAVVGDGHAVGVAAEIAQHMFGAAEGRLGMDVPSLLAQLVDQLLEPRRITEGSGRTSQVEQALAVEVAKSGEELVAEDGAQDGNRQRGTSDGWYESSAGDRPTVRRRERRSGHGNGAAGWNSRCAGWRGIRSRRRAAWDRRPLRAGSGNWPRTAGRAMACVKSVPAGSVRGAG